MESRQDGIRGWWPRLYPAALLAVVAAVLPPASAADGPAGLLVVLRPTAPVRGPFVRLDEVADIPSGPDSLRTWAGAVLLGFAPEAGAVREISAEEVEIRLRESGLPSPTFSVKGAPQTSAFLDGAAPAPPEAKEKTIGDAPPAAARGSRPGPRLVRTVPLEEIQRSFPRKPGTAPASRPPEKGPAAAEAAEGRTDAGSGSFSVEKGDAVTISMAGGALLVDEPGQALERASAGETLEVKNSRTGKKVAARLAAPGVVVPVESTKGEKGEPR